jgi:uncharacterized protein
MIKRINLRHLLLLGAFFAFGCASYQTRISSVRDLTEQRQYDDALEKLQKDIAQTQGDKLAYLLEYATVLHQAGRYKESNAAFESADQMCDLNDYTSVSRETGAMIVKEGMTQYKAETFEYLLINIYQALNYLLLDDLENAQVKARKLNDKINKIELGKETKIRQTSFAAYLAGLLWESQDDWDNAHILYKKAYELQPELELFKKSVLISAKFARREDTFEKFKKQWPEIHKSVDWNKLRSQGEFVFLFQQGWIPRKQYQRGNRRLPELVSVPSQSRVAELKVEGKRYTSETVYDLDAISKQTLNDDIGRLLARAVARQAGRIAVRESARHNNNNTGLAAAALATFVFEVMDVADLRQWSTLPQTFQMIRINLPPGSYDIRVDTVNGGETPLWSGTVKISKRNKVIKTARAF